MAKRGANKSPVNSEPSELPVVISDPAAEEETKREVPMPGANNPPCPSCGQPMTQSRKDGENHIRYYYCRSFGPAPACRSPGLYLTSKEWHRLHERIEQGIDQWRFDEDENRYVFERDVKTPNDFS